MKLVLRSLLVSTAAAMLLLSQFVSGQSEDDRQRVRTVSIPISIFTKEELKEGQAEELLQVGNLTLKENGREQTILSIRSRIDVPLSLAILIQDDLTSEFNLQIKDLQNFIRSLPKGSRVMVAYLRSGSPEIRQKFTDDLDRAAQSFRIVVSDPSAAPRTPWDGVSEILGRFDALPYGRRAILLVSNGLDLSSGLLGSSPGQSQALQSAILKAQRKSVAVFSIYSTTASSPGTPSIGSLNGQGSLAVIADETGGRTFAMGTMPPVSFEPFLRQLNVLIGRQFLLTYATDNMKKGYYKVDVKSTNPEVKIEHPKGYYYRP